MIIHINDFNIIYKEKIGFNDNLRRIARFFRQKI